MQKNETALNPIKPESETAPDRGRSGADAFTDLETGVFAALETYSNVHRGSGHFSVVSTSLYDRARAIVLEYLGLNKDTHVVIFCTQARANAIKKQLLPENYKCISSKDMGLALGVTGLAAAKKALPGGTPFQTGGGTARLLSPDWIVWAKSPDKFEAGTPPIIKVIAFARALLLCKR
jgi:selenocysteine lyase/cysteine desulfurase